MSAVVRMLPRRPGPLGLIVLLHAGLFFALERGQPQRTVSMQAAPAVMFASLITPAPPISRKPEPAVAPVRSPARRHKPKPAPAPKQQPPLPETPAAAAPPQPQPQPQPATLPIQPAPAAPAASAALPATPAAPAAPPKTVSGVEYLQAPQPVYPPMSRRLGEQGKTVLRVLVDEHGRAARIVLQQSSGSARLDEAARQAVARALFRPYLEDGVAIAVFALIPIKFQLDY